MAHGGQSRLRRRPVNSFFSALLLLGGDAGGRRKCSACAAIAARPRRPGARVRGRDYRRLIFIQIFSFGILVNHLPRLVSSTVWLIGSFLPPIWSFRSARKASNRMDRLSLALTLLGWVLIALLSFFVGVIVLRALRHATVLTRWTQRGDRSSGQEPP